MEKLISSCSLTVCHLMLLIKQHVSVSGEERILLIRGCRWWNSCPGVFQFTVNWYHDHGDISKEPAIQPCLLKRSYATKLQIWFHWIMFWCTILKTYLKMKRAADVGVARSWLCTWCVYKAHDNHITYVSSVLFIYKSNHNRSHLKRLYSV